jgi:hypothetical protein
MTNLGSIAIAFALLVVAAAYGLSHRYSFHWIDRQGVLAEMREDHWTGQVCLAAVLATPDGAFIQAFGRC